MEKKIFHFDTPLGIDNENGEFSIPSDVAKEIEDFRCNCESKKGKVGFRNDNTYNRSRLEVLCETEPSLKEE
jgi:hypothetical protein